MVISYRTPREDLDAAEEVLQESPSGLQAQEARRPGLLHGGQTEDRPRKPACRQQDGWRELKGALKGNEASECLRYAFRDIYNNL